MLDQLPNITTVKDRAKSKLERDAREILSALKDPETVEIMVAKFYGKQVIWFNSMIEGEFLFDNSRFAVQLPHIYSTHFCHL